MAGNSDKYGKHIRSRDQILPRYNHSTGGAVKSSNGSAIEVQNVDASDIFELG